MTTPLRLARERRGLTLRQVASSLNMDPANLSRVERGENGVSKETAEALAKFFGHDVTEMQIIFPERYLPTAG